MNKKRKWLTVTGLLLFMFVAAGSVQIIRSKLVSASAAADVLSYRKNAIISQEQNCSDRLQNQRVNGQGNNRNRINNSGPYGQDLWVSPDGQPASGIATSRGATQIGLRLYANEIICSAVVQPNQGDNLDVKPETIITDGQFPNDRSPNKDGNGTDSSTVHAASLYGTYTYIRSASVSSGGGSIVPTSNPAGSKLFFDRDDNSRFWFTKSNGFTYDTDGPIYKDRDVVIRLNVSAMNRYHSTSGVVQCNGPGNVLISGLDPNSVGDYDRCTNNDVYVSFHITVPDELPSVSVGLSGSCNGNFTIRALDTDNTGAKLRVDIYEDDSNPPGNDPAGGSTRQYSMYTTPGAGGAAGTATVSLEDVLKSGNSSGNPYAVGRSDRTGSLDWSKRRFYAYAMSVNHDGNEVPNAHTKSNPVDIGPCATVSCKANTLIAIGTATVNGPTDVYITMAAANATASPPPNAQATVNISGPGGYRSGALTTGGGFTYGDNKLTSNNPVTFRPPSSGTYTATWSYAYTPDGLAGQARQTTTGADCNGPIVAAFSPYFRINGGDAVVGAGFTDSAHGICDADDTANLYGKNRSNDGGSYYGAGTQLAALVLGAVRGVATGTTDSGVSSGPDPMPRALMFATSSAGRFGLHNWCVPDYGQGGSESNDTAPGNIDLSSAALSGDKFYAMTGPVNITASAPIGAGKHLKLVLTGNQTVRINSNVLYDYNNLKDIPNIQIIVNGGNLAVDYSVDTLYGTYIAEKRVLRDGQPASGGLFNTCTIGGAAIRPAVAAEVERCKNGLTIYGPTAASKFILSRTNGNLYAASGTDTSVAETFVFSPQAWVPSKQDGIGKVDAITSLPPVL